MTGVLRAIPTRYQGILFRSKLEADWAITLDRCGIPWVYEPEGRYYGSVYYAPDFYLPMAGQWLEVKGQHTEYDLVKWKALAAHWRQPKTPEIFAALMYFVGEAFMHELGPRVPPLAVAWPHGRVGAGYRAPFKAIVVRGYGVVAVHPDGPRPCHAYAVTPLTRFPVQRRRVKNICRLCETEDDLAPSRL